MISIFKNEFRYSLLSIKSICVMGALIALAFISANTIKNSEMLELQSNTTSIYMISIEYFLLLFGYLLLSIMCYNTVNKEVETKSIRFLVTKTSRLNIIVGKILGSNAFALFIFIIPMMCISIYSRQLLLFDYLGVFAFILFVMSLIILISVLINRVGVALLINLSLAFVIPILGIYGFANHNLFANLITYTIPFYAVLEKGLPIFSIILLSILINAVSIVCFLRKDL